MHAFSKLYRADFVCPSKGQTSVVLSSIFCLNPVPNVHSTTPVEVLLKLLLITRNPSLLVLKIYGKANFLKMLIDVDHDNLRTVLLQTPNTSHSYLLYKSRIPLFRRSMYSLKNPSTMTPSPFIF